MDIGLSECRTAYSWRSHMALFALCIPQPSMPRLGITKWQEAKVVELFVVGSNSLAPTNNLIWGPNCTQQCSVCNHIVSCN